MIISKHKLAADRAVQEHHFAVPSLPHPPTETPAGLTPTNTPAPPTATPPPGSDVARIQRITYTLSGKMIGVRVVELDASDVVLSDELYYVLTNHLGSVMVISDDAGNMVGDVIRYEPFGANRGSSLPSTNPSITDRGFTGHRENLDIGLTYMNARYYDATLNRALSADTIVPNPINPQSYNRYSYTLNNPVNYTDSTGHYVDQYGAGGGGTPGCIGGTLSVDCGTGYVGAIGLSSGGAVSPEMQSLTVAAVGMLWEPADWAIALSDGAQWHDGLAFLPILPASIGRYADDVAPIVSKHLTRFIDRYGYESLNAVRGYVKPNFVNRLIETTQGNFRTNLARYTGFLPTGAYQAHHVLPQKFGDQFGRIGIQIHDPKYGSWVNAFDHQKWSGVYNRRWDSFLNNIAEQGRDPSMNEIFDFARGLADEFGFDVNF